MALEYNYFVEQESYIRNREPPVQLYAYQSSPSCERRSDGYPSMYKIFNNRPSFDDPNLGVFNMSQQTPMPQQSNKKHVPHQHQKVRFVEPRGEIRQKKDAEAEGIDAAADGFISWKHKSLQMNKT